MKIFDAHVHFDCNTKEPYEDLLEKLEKNKITHCNLILNSLYEEQIFFKKKHLLQQNNIISNVSAILDIHDKNTLLFWSKARNLNINISVKLHPRLTHITKQDFNDIYYFIANSNLKNIIIDSFVYGPCIENHVGTELAVFLAEKMLDKKIIIAHAGGCDLLKTMLITRPVKNIYFDYSLTCNYLQNTSVYQDMINGLAFYSDRIVFGTDFPDFSFKEVFDSMLNLCNMAQLSSLQIENIFFNSAHHIFEMDDN